MSKLKSIIKNRLLRPAMQFMGCGFLSSVGLEHIDLQLVSILRHKRNGFFIEAGANNGIRQSNTYYLEKILGWKGLLVEPLPPQADECRLNRRNSKVVNAALVRHDYPNPTVEIEAADLMSVVNDGSLDASAVEQHVARGRAVQRLAEERVYSVEAVSLSHLLKQNSVTHVDFFSLDVEGYEAEVLRGIDFEAVRFDHIFIETRPENESEIDELLAAAGLKMTHQWLNPSYSNKLYSRVEA